MKTVCRVARPAFIVRSKSGEQTGIIVPVWPIEPAFRATMQAALVSSIAFFATKVEKWTVGSQIELDIDPANAEPAFAKKADGSQGEALVFRSGPNAGKQMHDLIVRVPVGSRFWKAVVAEDAVVEQSTPLV